MYTLGVRFFAFVNGLPSTMIALRSMKRSMRTGKVQLPRLLRHLLSRESDDTASTGSTIAMYITGLFRIDEQFHWYGEPSKGKWLHQRPPGIFNRGHLHLATDTIASIDDTHLGRSHYYLATPFISLIIVETMHAMPLLLPEMLPHIGPKSTDQHRRSLITLINTNTKCMQPPDGQQDY